MRNSAIALLFLVGCCSNSCFGRILSQCEFIEEFQKYSTQISRDDLNKWTCIVHHQSNFSSTKRTVGADGTTYYGLFQLSGRYICSQKSDDERVCQTPCSKFEDDHLDDDFECVLKIYADRLKSGPGFSAWPIYLANCTIPKDYMEECRHNATQSITNMSKIYDRCELAQELYTIHKFPMDQISTWICIVEHESNYNTSAVGASRGHGLFQINDIYWCSIDDEPKLCAVPCSKLEDSDISDDVGCAKRIFQQHQDQFSDGFHAWYTYAESCYNRTSSYVSGCFGDDDDAIQTSKSPTVSPQSQLLIRRRQSVGKVFKRCELAQELRTTHNFPMDQIHLWICIVQHASNYNTSFIGNVNMDGSYNHGLFQLSDRYWCSSDGNPKGCGVPCSKFEDADISDDVECARRLFEINRKLFSDGFHAWVPYIEPCQDRNATLRYIDGCFNDNNNVEIISRVRRFPPNVFKLSSLPRLFLSVHLTEIWQYGRPHIAHII